MWHHGDVPRRERTPRTGATLSYWLAQLSLTKTRKRPATAAGRSSIGEELVPTLVVSLPGRGGGPSRGGRAVSEARSTHPFIVRCPAASQPVLPRQPAVLRLS